MKKIFVLCFVFSFWYTGNLTASTSDLFTIDEEEFYNELSGLTALDEYIESNEGITLSSIDVSSFVGETGMVNTLSDVMNFWKLNEPPLGIPSFLWGCGLGWVGIVLVYFISEKDNEETKKAAYGCITQMVLVSVLYLVIVVFSFSYY